MHRAEVILRARIEKAHARGLALAFKALWMKQQLLIPVENCANRMNHAGLRPKTPGKEKISRSAYPARLIVHKRS